MRVLVCVKQVPGTTEVRLDPVTNTIIRDGRQAITNPFDTYAIEEAIRLGEELGAETVALSMGIPETERLLRDASARGIRRSVLLSDRGFAGADTLATAYTLGLGIRHIGGADLILCGKMAVDGDTAQIGPELAECMGIPHVADVCAIEEVSEESVTVSRTVQGGIQRLRVQLPALLTVVKNINQPRMPSISGVRFSLEAPFELYTVADLNANPKRIGLNGSPTQVTRTFTPERETTATSIEGDAAEQAGQLAEILQELYGKEGL